MLENIKKRSKTDPGKKKRSKIRVNIALIPGKDWRCSQLSLTPQFTTTTSLRTQRGRDKGEHNTRKMYRNYVCAKN